MYVQRSKNRASLTMGVLYATCNTRHFVQKYSNVNFKSYHEKLTYGATHNEVFRMFVYGFV